MPRPYGRSFVFNDVGAWHAKPVLAGIGSPTFFHGPSRSRLQVHHPPSVLGSGPNWSPRVFSGRLLQLDRWGYSGIRHAIPDSPAPGRYQVPVLTRKAGSDLVPNNKRTQFPNRHRTASSARRGVRLCRAALHLWCKVSYCSSSGTTPQATEKETLRYKRKAARHSRTPRQSALPVVTRADIHTLADSIFSSKDEPEDGGWGFLRSWGSFLVFWF